MDIDIMSMQLADLMRRVTALEGGPQPKVMSPEGVPQALTEERVRQMLGEYDAERTAREFSMRDTVAAEAARSGNQTARGAEPGGSATGAAGQTGMSSQVQPGSVVRDTPPSSQEGTPFAPFVQPGTVAQSGTTVGPGSPTDPARNGPTSAQNRGRRPE